VARLAEGPERFRATDIQVVEGAGVFAKAMLPTVLALVGNMLAVCYMFQAEWTALTVLFLFWVESVTLGVVTLGRMLAALPGYAPVPRRKVTYARGEKSGVNESWSSIEPSISSLFGWFVMYTVILAVSALMGARLLGGSSWAATLTSLRLQMGGVALVLMLDFGQQAVSAWMDFVHGPDWARRDPLFQTRGLLGRGIGLYLLVFLAALMVGSFHWPRGFLVVFIVVKTLIEIVAVNFNARIRGDWRRSFPERVGEPDLSQLSGSAAGRS
jgi:hypothetical protein